MEQQLSLNLLNKATYEREDVIKYYRSVDALLEAEKVLFGKLRHSIGSSQILDIGIGGGRTTKHLLEISENYTGVDYVERFTEETAKKYPAAKVLCRDAANLYDLEDDTYGFVLFSYNGIDSISHRHRLQVLKEVYRVMKKGGVFMFSSHNRDYVYFNKFPWQQRFHYSARHLIFLLHCLYHLPNHYRMKKYEIHTEDYAMVNDGDHRYSLLLYYISIDKQCEQLTDLGFSGTEAYDVAGDPVIKDTRSHWIHYLARK